MKINDQVLIGKTKIPGVVKEIGENNSVLVNLEVKINGYLKSVNQWYSLDMITEVDLHEEAEDVFRELEEKGMTSKEIEDLVSAGGAKFQDTAILMGVLPKES